MATSTQVKGNINNSLIQTGINLVNGIMFSECAKNGFTNPIMNGIQRFAHLSGGINWTGADTASDEITKFLDSERKCLIQHKSITEGLVTAGIGTACTVVDDVFNHFNILDKVGIKSGNHLSDIFSCGYVFYDSTEALGKLWTWGSTKKEYDIDDAKNKFNKFLVAAFGGLGLFGIKKLFGMNDYVSEQRAQAVKLAESQKLIKEITKGEVDLSMTSNISFIANEVLTLGSKVGTAFLMNDDALTKTEKVWKGWDKTTKQAIYEDKQVFDLTKVAVNLCGSIGGFISSRMLGGTVNNFIFNRVNLGVSDKLNLEINKIISTPELLLKASSDTEMSKSLTSMTSDAKLITKDVKKLMEAQSALLQSITRSGEIGVYGTSILEAFDNSSKVNESAKKLGALESEFTQKKADLDMMNNEVFSQPRTVIERGGFDFYVPQIENTSKELSQLKKDVADTNSDYYTSKSIGTLMPIAGLLAKAHELSGLGAARAILVGRDVYQNDQIFKTLENIVLDSLLNLPRAITTAAQVMIAKGIANHAQNKTLELDDMSISLERMSKLLKFIDSVENTSHVKYYTNPNLNGIKLQKIEVSVAGEKRLCVEDFTLNYGKNYLFTGKSGCGKTTLFSSLFGLPNFSEAIEVKGSITYGSNGGKAPAILLLTQNDNFAGNVTLLENIIYPTLVSKEKQMSYAPLIEKMLIEIQGINPDVASHELAIEKEYGLPSRLFEVQQNMYTSFSGGQKKKIAIVGMVFNVMYKTGMLDIYFEAIENGKNHKDALALAKKSASPVMIMLDEIYNGLDDVSKKNATALIRTYSPEKAVTVTIEHQPQRNNYDYELHMKGNGQVNFTDLKSGFNKGLNHNFDEEVILEPGCEEFSPLASCAA